MPRAIGVFRRIGWNVTAWPVAYKAGHSMRAWIEPSMGQKISYLNSAAHEWLGLLDLPSYGQDGCAVSEAGAVASSSYPALMRVGGGAMQALHLALALGVALSLACRTCSRCSVASPTWSRSKQGWRITRPAAIGDGSVLAGGGRLVWCAMPTRCWGCSMRGHTAGTAAGGACGCRGIGAQSCGATEPAGMPPPGGRLNGKANGTGLAQLLAGRRRAFLL